MGFRLPSDFGDKYLKERANMCGIVGCLSKEAVAPLLLESLISLEYRDHDSAGIATLE